MRSLFLWFCLFLGANITAQVEYKYPCNGYLAGFNGSTYIEAEWPNLISNSISIAAWVRSESDAPNGMNQGIYYRAVNGNNPPYADSRAGVVINHAGQFMFVGKFSDLPNSAAGTVDSLLSNIYPVKSKWYHIAATFDESTRICNFYVNGRLEASKVMPGLLNYPYGVNYKTGSIGCASASFGSGGISVREFFTGYIDDVIISTRALTNSEIDTIALQNLTDQQYNDFRVAAHWSLNEGAGGVTTTAFNPIPQSGTGFGKYAYFRNAAWVICSGNKSPVAKTSGDQDIFFPDNSVILDASTSEDADGSITSFAWSQKSGPSPAIINNKNATTSEVSGLVEGEYIFQVVVTDDKGAIGTAECKIKVLRVEHKLYNASTDFAIHAARTIDNVQAHPPASGICADGQSQIILQIESSAPVQLFLDQKGDGILESYFKPGDKAQELVVEPVGGKIVVLYTSPELVGEQQKTRTININVRFQNTNSVLKIPLLLSQPPIVLIHDTWGDETDWRSGGFYRFLQDEVGYTADDIHEVAYRSVSSSGLRIHLDGLDGLNSASEATLFYIRTAIRNAQRISNAKGLATTQVDIIAHGVGGMRARKYMETFEEDAFRWFYKKGYVRKFITLGTPHLGTRFGPVMFDGSYEVITLDAYDKVAKLEELRRLLTRAKKVIPNWLDIAVDSYSVVSTYLNKKRIGQAFKDLEPDITKNEALRSFRRVKVRTHAIGADHLPGNDTSFALFDDLVKNFNERKKVLTIDLNSDAKGLSEEMDSFFHDLFVNEQSAHGKLTNKMHKSTVPSTLHSSQFRSSPSHVHLLNSPAVFSKVKQLLLSDKHADFADYLPAITEEDHPGTLSKNGNRNTFKSERLSGLADTKNIHLSDTGFISFDQSIPRYGHKAGNNNELKIKVNFERGALPEVLYLLVGRDRIMKMATSNPAVVNLPLPADLSPGPLRLAVIGFKDSVTIYADTLTIFVENNTPTQSTEIFPTDIVLDTAIRSTFINIVSYFDEQGIKKMINRQNFFQTFNIQSPNFELTPDGEIVAKAPGRDSFYIEVAGHRQLIRVNVDSSFVSRQMSESRIVFEDIPDIILGDDPVAPKAEIDYAADISFSIVEGRAMMYNGRVFYDRPGKITVQANAAGTVYSKSPPPVNQSFCINPLKPNVFNVDSLTCPGETRYWLEKDTTVNFRWNITGGVSSNLTTDTLKVFWSAPGIKTIKVVAEADGCVSEPYEAQLQVVSSVAKPDIIPSGPLALCRGSAVKLSIDSSGSIQWFKNDSIIQGATAASYMVSQEGRYSVQQQLTGGCTMMSDTVTITVTGVPVETNITASGPTEGCVGDTLVLSTTTTGNITWFLNDTVITGANQSSLVVFKSGRYYVRSDNACASTASRTIDVKLSPVPPTPSIVANGVYELCQGDSAILTSSGQLLNEWYLNGEAIPAAVDSTLIVTRGGRYSVRVKGPGCPSALSPTVEISFRGLSNIVIESARTEICEDDSVTLSAQSSASIAWYRDGLLIADNSLPYLITRLPGKYTAVAINQGSCPSQASNEIIIHQSTKPVSGFTVPLKACTGQQLQFLKEDSATGDHTVRWFFGDGGTSIESSPVYRYQSVGTFRATLIVTNKTCESLKDTSSQLILVQNAIKAINYPAVYVAAGASIQVKARTVGQEYLWRPSQGLSNVFIADPVLTATTPRRYTVDITTSDGCMVTDTLDVFLKEGVGVFVPKAFAPDNNGSNDLLRPILQNIRELRFFRVFNRWGQLVYETRITNAGWDGTLNSNPQPTDTFMWYFEGVGTDGKIIKQSGKTLLIR